MIQSINPDYLVSDSGEVYSKIRKRILKQHIRKDGYVICGKPGNYTHRLICATFHPNPNNLPWVNHKDGNKQNNHKDNLEWSSISQNIQHAHDTGLKLIKRGLDHWNTGRKLTQDTKGLMSRQKIGVNHPAFIGWYITPNGRFDSSIAASKMNNVAPATVKRRCNNKIWLHLGWSFEAITR